VVEGVPAGQTMRLAIGLPLRNAVELDQLLKSLYDPASPQYRRFLGAEDFVTRFGPTQEDYRAVQDFARTHRLMVTRTYPNRRLIDVEGAAQDVENAFHL
jgi:kumamolisin